MTTADFHGRVGVVTGGGSGIGAACARLLAERGARVVVADRDGPAAAAVAGEIDGLPYAADVADPAACEAMVAAAVGAFGRLDVAVNCAGISGPSAVTGEYPLDAWASVLAVNLSGVFHSMRAQIPAMLAGGGGAIVNVASMLGGVGFAKSSAYVAAKHGVVGLTKAAALEYAKRGIRVNSVGPGFIDTPFLAGAPRGVAFLHPSGRLGRADEVAELVAFVASERASNTTGSHLLCDGGYTAQ